MGLTIHYTLSAPDARTEDEALRRITRAHQLATRMAAEGTFRSVSGLRFDAASRRAATQWRWVSLATPEHPRSGLDLEIRPCATALFCVEVGRDCEPLWVGLCRYPAKIFSRGYCVRTHLERGWRLAGFAKTQYASLHGWEHFRRCHVGIVTLLAGLRPLGFRLRISDEGDYWPRRSERALRENLDGMNRLVAATAGAMKDASDAQVKSPIFGHREFERLEAEGAARIPPGFAEWLQKEAE